MDLCMDAPSGPTTVILALLLSLVLTLVPDLWIIPGLGKKSPQSSVRVQSCGALVENSGAVSSVSSDSAGAAC